MAENQRFLKHNATYYENAMLQANNLSIFNQTTLQNDFQLHVFWCRYIHYKTQSKIPPNTSTHAHSFFELHCVLNGNFEYKEPEQEPRQITAGSFILIAPQTPHSFKPLHPDSETFAITFHPICDDTEQGRKIKAQFDIISSIAAPFDAEICQLIELIMLEFHDNRAFCIYNIKSLLTIFITNILRHIFQTASPATPENPYDIRLVNLDKYIADNQHKILSVGELADYLNVGTRQLRNIIQSNLGMSVKSYLDSCKARQARKLLLETELSLQQISEMLGFSEHNNFNRFFKRIEGMPPGIFRLSKGKFIDTQQGHHQPPTT